MDAVVQDPRNVPASPVMVPVPLPDIFRLAAQQEAAGRMEEADRLLSHILAVAPHQADTLHMSGIVAFRLGRHQEALDKIEAEIERGGDIALDLRNICDIYRTLKRLEG